MSIGFGPKTHRFADGLDADNIDGAGADWLAGRRASRVDFTLRQGANDTRGFEFTVDGDNGDVLFVLTCRGPTRSWRRIEEECRRLVDHAWVRWPDAVGKPVQSAAPSASDPVGAGVHQSGKAGAPEGSRKAVVGGSMEPPSVGKRTLVPGLPASAWRKTSWAYANREQVKFAPSGVKILYPSSVRGGGAGVTTTNSAVRLGDLARGAVTRITYEFDQTISNAFRISLCPARVDNCWSEQGYTLTWHPSEAAPGAQLERASGDGKHVPIAISASRPGRVQIALSARGVEVSGDGITTTLDRWPLLRSFLTFELHVEEIGIEGKDTALALASIAIEEEPASAATSKPVATEAGRVPPLPQRTIFDGTLGSGWETLLAPAGTSATFTPTPDGLIVDQRPGTGAGGSGERGWAGLVSRTPLYEIPFKNDNSPRRLKLEFDPDRTTGFALVLSHEKIAADPYSAAAFVAWTKFPDGRGKLTLRNCGSDPRTFEMLAPTGWTGHLDLLVHPNAVELGLDAQWRMAALWTCVTARQQLYVSAFAMGETGQPARASLQRIVTERVAPPGMTEASRFGLLDDDQFDPGQYLEMLARLRDAKGKRP